MRSKGKLLSGSGGFFQRFGEINALFLKSKGAQTSPGSIIKDAKYCKTKQGRTAA